MKIDPGCCITERELDSLAIRWREELSLPEMVCKQEYLYALITAAKSTLSKKVKRKILEICELEEAGNEFCYLTEIEVSILINKDKPFEDILPGEFCFVVLGPSTIESQYDSYPVGYFVIKNVDEEQEMVYYNLSLGVEELLLVTNGVRYRPEGDV